MRKRKAYAEHRAVLFWAFFLNRIGGGDNADLGVSLLYGRGRLRHHKRERERERERARESDIEREGSDSVVHVGVAPGGREVNPHQDVLSLSLSLYLSFTHTHSLSHTVSISLSC